MVVLMGIAFMGGKAGVIILFSACSYAALRIFIILTKKMRGQLSIFSTFFCGIAYSVRVFLV
jgi:phosphatidate cytidylyltransferase